MSNRIDNNSAITNALKKSQLFGKLDKKTLEKVADSARLLSLKKDSVIFYEKDEAHSFYIVADGKVKIFKVSPEGKEQILMIAKEGDSFAEAALFSGSSYPASAQALESGSVLQFQRNIFVDLLKNNSDLAVNLIARLSELLRKMTRLVEDLSLANVTTRLAHYLIESSDDNLKIHLDLKKAVLASQLGTIPETLSRSFARLTQKKIISIDGPDIEILDIDKLSDIAEGV